MWTILFLGRCWCCFEVNLCTFENFKKKTIMKKPYTRRNCNVRYFFFDWKYHMRFIKKWNIWVHWAISYEELYLTTSLLSTENISLMNNLFYKFILKIYARTLYFYWFSLLSLSLHRSLSLIFRGNARQTAMLPCTCLRPVRVRFKWSSQTVTVAAAVGKQPFVLLLKLRMTSLKVSSM